MLCAQGGGKSNLAHEKKRRVGMDGGSCVSRDPSLVFLFLFLLFFYYLLIFTFYLIIPPRKYEFPWCVCMACAAFFSSFFLFEWVLASGAEWWAGGGERKRRGFNALSFDVSLSLSVCVSG